MSSMFHSSSKESSEAELSDARGYGPKVEDLEPDDKRYEILQRFCYDNSKLGPYVTDFFHEQRTVMKGIKARDPGMIAFGMYRQSGNIISDYAVEGQLRFTIQRIRIIHNNTVSDSYGKRRIRELQRFSEDGMQPDIPAFRAKATIVNRSIGAGKLKKATLTSSQVKANSLTGSVIDEASLSTVPQAQTAVSATSRT